MMIPARRNGNGLDIFDEVFTDPFFGEKENKIMKTDLKEKDGKYMLEIDVPGYDKEDIKIELQDGYLTVSAEKNEEKEDKHAKYLKRERFTGMCSRSYYVGDNLKEEDIKYFRPLIRNQYFPAVELFVIRNEIRQIVAFMGLSDDMLEMLFVLPEEQGYGYGKGLVDYAINKCNIYKVDVNEDNEQAYQFYLHMGYEVIGRDEYDSSGKPFPILHLQQPSNR